MKANNEVYFSYEQKTSVLARHTLTPVGIPQRFDWSDQKQDWESSGVGQFDLCENYAACGPNARCDASSSPPCGCLYGYKPKSPGDWNLSVWSEGCNRRTSLDCSDKDGFLTYSRFKLPDTSSSWFDKSIGLKECKTLCLKNCSCTAYANLDIRGGGSGCLIWFGHLIDARTTPIGDGQDLYVKIAASELDMPSSSATEY
ncbi:unnamed protein product [Dovyalis caffra]|uniref:Apple domain-containing protein n=1 Tax=Dovyalis caffra TaxID=77055 RepID=A0AAV1R0G3_9ROSI|nr:unnamed protein product [Dovyalis caffra]